MTVTVSDFCDLYHAVRRHEHVAGDRPLERYLDEPEIAPSDAEPTALPPGQTTRIP